MFGIFSRIFKVMQSEAHSAVDKLEDPIKMTEQGIRDLKQDLHGAMASLAQVKALAIRMRKDSEDQKKLASDYERKAMLLLQKAQGGEIAAEEADRLATEALTRKEEAVQKATQFNNDHVQQQKMADQLQVKVEKLRRTISQYENDLITLRARARTAQSMRKINQQLANVDSSSTIQMLEKMKEKVTEEESLAEAYAQLGDVGGNIDEEIDKVLTSPASVQAKDSLAELKKKMGIAAG